jgi:hypothetical protein
MPEHFGIRIAEADKDKLVGDCKSRYTALTESLPQ